MLSLEVGAEEVSHPFIHAPTVRESGDLQAVRFSSESGAIRVRLNLGCERQCKVSYDNESDL